MIILDMGSANICKNDQETIREMIQSIADIDSGKNKIIFKWQLFTEKTISYLTPLKHGLFDYAYKLAHDLGYETTSSVFDDESLEFLQNHYKIPFIKIACNPKYHQLLWHVNPEIDKYVSIDHPSEELFRNMYEGMKIITLSCISEYPATIQCYRIIFPEDKLKKAVSDHTIGLELYNHYKPEIWEKHFKYGEPNDPYGDSFCITVEELKEIL